MEISLINIEWSACVGIFFYVILPALAIFNVVLLYEENKKMKKKNE